MTQSTSLFLLPNAGQTVSGHTASICITACVRRTNWVCVFDRSLVPRMPPHIDENKPDSSGCQLGLPNFNWIGQLDLAVTDLRNRLQDGPVTWPFRNRLVPERDEVRRGLSASPQARTKARPL